MPFRVEVLEPSQVPISQHGRALRCYGTLTRPTSSVDRGLGHSYGGEVATRAWRLGTKINEVVLLSTPATAHVRTAVDHGLKTVDIRLPFDPVLALARTPQRIRRKALHLTEVVLPQWHLSHGATHDPDVWQSEDLVQRARL